VVDDDDVNRRGLACLLDDSPEVSLVGALTHGEALGWTDQWAGVDVVLVDAADERSTVDQFPGVGVVEHIRRHRTPAQLTVVVATGHFFDDAVRRRMREARADVFYHRSELADVRALLAAVLRPDLAGRQVPGPADPEAQFCQGVTDATRVNPAVAFATEHGVAAALADRPQPRSRAWIRLRREFNRHAKLSPVTVDGREPDRTQDLPSVPQIGRFLAWATRAKTPVPPSAERTSED
jgi:DNA-binding NarL/FixJ family response regulator